MPDNYIYISGEKGSINISEDVIAAIAANTVSEMDGIAAFSNITGADLSELIGKKPAARGIRVSFEDNRVSIDIGVLVRYGVSITAVGTRVQQEVSSAVESMTGLKPSVNVHVAGVAFSK